MTWAVPDPLPDMHMSKHRTDQQLPASAAAMLHTHHPSPHPHITASPRHHRLFKLPGRLETLCEDYGQVATYKGTIPGHIHAYDLDDHHTLETGRPMLVCGNTASMLGETWLAPHFDVLGNRNTHFGLFDCSAPAPVAGDGACGPAGCC